MTAPKAKIPIRIRPFEPGDLPVLLDENQPGLARRERVEIRTRRAHYDAAIPTCYVAVDENTGSPCYFQWLMGPRQNAKIQSLFPPRWFPVLQEDEALLENAYTPVAYRGNGIMSAAMALIAERAVDLGCRFVITFVDRDNTPSLRGCKKAGFSPYLVRTETQFLNLVKQRRFKRFEEC